METVKLSREQAQRVKDALEAASDIVVALEWIGSQKGETHEMTGALEAVKACSMRLDQSVGDTYEIMHNAMMNGEGRQSRSQETANV